MSQLRTLTALLFCTALVAGGIGLAAATVPDARLTVEDVIVEPETPAPGETTTVEVTVANSVGSTSGATIDSIALHEGNTTYANETNVGALSPGDDLTVPVAAVFDDAGVHDLTVEITATDEDGEPVTVTRPLRVLVGGVDEGPIDDDVEIEVREPLPGDFETEGDANVNLDVGDVGNLDSVLGGVEGPAPDDDDETSTQAFGDSVVTVEVTNFGSATVRDVVINPGSEALARQPLPDIEPGDTAHLPLDLSSIDDDRTVEVSVRYTLGTTPFASTTTYDYRPEQPSIDLTDIDMVADGERVEISGNVGNTGTASADGVVVATETTDTVGPTYPQRSYFVGSVPESDFIGFELTASADPENATTVPVTVTYQHDGVQRQETVELPFEPRDGSVDEGGTTIAPLAVVTIAGLGLAGIGAVVWRRRVDE